MYICMYVYKTYHCKLGVAGVSICVYRKYMYLFIFVCIFVYMYIRHTIVNWELLAANPETAMQHPPENT